jgi:hypothetical protein
VSNLNNTHLKEATAAFIHLIKNGSTQDDEAIKKIRILKPHLNDETIIIGLSRAKELLFKPEYLTEELRREIEQWDSAEDS